ncbi:transposase, IS605 family protein [Lacticaseibacillus pantheris DSM 15945 = JCM 12539 = NBRC 106106]|uniref:Transposase, IS605 family protein n=1 Tax=Lacticaseibacillus pantheris DSM 15945 = JCM 12539 = NBRC 106106 TaxID=1423783 RepID=A0A0R1U3Q1_9LACO|nr:RNA-guided endonuclease TnpB family protein [Lacticaseibacillus pantheris]KRL87917.1 transposase, IS605 family protein [Lacticaseibacillus pantheris DSM 15945 = JCM 12539 = NBRC 106106]
MIKTHRIKLYPNATMRRAFQLLFDYRRYCYNLALESWNGMYDESLFMDDKSLRPNERKVRNELVNNKQDWQYELSARVLQLAVHDLAQGWRNFFNPQMPNHGRPRFKSKKRSRNTFTTDRARVVNKKLRIDRPRGCTSWYDIRMAEPVRWAGQLKTATVVEEADGYYVALVVEVDESVAVKAGHTVTGVDANIARFDYRDATGYQSVSTMSAKLLRLYDRITHYQRLLARKRVANPSNFRSQNYRATRAKLQRDYQKVTRIQMDLLHKFTHQLVQTNDVIVIEDLDNLHMHMNKRLAKNLHRSLFGKFKKLMQYKCAWSGVKLVMVDRFYPSTQRCSQCSFVKTGADRIALEGNRRHHTGHDQYLCYQCGASMRRDQNAVENLIQYAMVN